MNSLQKKLNRLLRRLEKAGNNEVILDDLQLEKLEREIEKVEHELLRPIHTTEEVEDDEDDTDTSDL